MQPTLRARGDRAGHAGWLALVLLACLLAPSLAAAADYKARRFDVHARVLDGGHLDVTETITFEFQSGTFKKVWREIPSYRTTGIEILEAWMDGNPVTRGEGPGHIVVSGRNKIRVEWQLAPAGPSTHTFALRYIARGVAYGDAGKDVVRWRFLPSEHRYKIDASRITVTAPVGPSDAPSVESRHVGGVSSSRSGTGIEIVATDIRRNGSVFAELHYPSGTLVTEPPEWRQRQLAAAALAPRWAMAAGGVLVAGILILLVTRQGYATPGFDEDDRTTTTEPPEALPAALAAALVANGRGSGFQSVATLLDLAERGALVVRELPRKLGTRHYELSQVPGTHHLEDHETEALSLAFAGSGDDVSMSKARARLARGAKRFSDAVNGDLAARGLLDPSRKAVRDRLTAVSVVMLLVAGAGAIGLATLIRRFEGWPFLLPLAFAIAGIVGLVMAGTTTSLSDTGLMQGARWRGFKRHLKELADARDDRGGAPVRSRWIVYGIALGLASQWSRYLKQHPGAAPSWFVVGSDDASGSFATFVGSSAASTNSGGSGGGGAAGGVGSGAG